ncbi:MAG: ornithine carbamoyltransferase [Deltaproteobacteria bacterium]|nr:ornithine carbamoyltransferase [Deltaproteobacteria bacterium]
MRPKDLVGLNPLNKEELRDLLAFAQDVKTHRDRYRGALTGKILAMIFQKPSTRTRVSFHGAMMQLGGNAMVLTQNDLQLGRGETVADTARVLSRYVDGIMARVFAHADIEALAENASVPVINGLSDRLHPCQALADYLTMQERFGDIAGLPVTYIGDGNNVAHSLAFGAAKLGVNLTIGCPSGNEPDPTILATANAEGQTTGATIRIVHDPQEAVTGAKVVYADVWTSMGEEAKAEEKRAALAAYQVNKELFGRADTDAIFMHCLPAHRGEEVTDEIADHERSRIFDQAENRLHTQKALLIELLGG